MKAIEAQYKDIIEKLDTIANTIIEIAGDASRAPENPNYAAEGIKIESMTLKQIPEYIELIEYLAWNRGYHKGFDDGEAEASR